MWCKIRDRIISSVGDWNWKAILFYIAIILVFVVVAYQTYNKYILPRLNPDFVPNKEFENDKLSLSGGKKGGEVAELIFFCVKWCPHCKKATPEWEKLVQKFKDRKINGVNLYFKKVDCEDNEEFANEYNIEGYPTIKMIKNDEIIEYNAKPNAETLEEFLRTTL